MVLESKIDGNLMRKSPSKKPVMKIFKNSQNTAIYPLGRDYYQENKKTVLRK